MKVQWQVTEKHMVPKTVHKEKSTPRKYCGNHKTHSSGELVADEFCFKAILVRKAHRCEQCTSDGNSKISYPQAKIVEVLLNIYALLPSLQSLL
jgi:hypothetical protein